MVNVTVPVVVPKVALPVVGVVKDVPEPPVTAWPGILVHAFTKKHVDRANRKITNLDFCK